MWKFISETVYIQVTTQKLAWMFGSSSWNLFENIRIIIMCRTAVLFYTVKTILVKRVRELKIITISTYPMIRGLRKFIVSRWWYVCTFLPICHHRSHPSQRSALWLLATGPPHAPQGKRTGPGFNATSPDSIRRKRKQCLSSTACDFLRRLWLRW